MASDVTLIKLPDGTGAKIHDQLYKIPKQTISIVSGTVAYTFTVDVTANLTKIVLVMPALSGAVVTAVVSIVNSDSITIYESSACAENDTHIISPSPAVALIGINTFTLTCNTDPLSSGTAYIIGFLEGN